MEKDVEEAAGTGNGDGVDDNMDTHVELNKIHTEECRCAKLVPSVDPS